MDKQKKKSEQTTDEDLGIKIGSRREVIFSDLKKATLVQIEGQEKALEANQEIVKMCTRVIEEEKEKFK